MHCKGITRSYNKMNSFKFYLQSPVTATWYPNYYYPTISVYLSKPVHSHKTIKEFNISLKSFSFAKISSRILSNYNMNEKSNYFFYNAAAYLVNGQSQNYILHFLQTTPFVNCWNSLLININEFFYYTLLKLKLFTHSLR